MTKTRDLADLGGGFIQAGTGAVQRTVESKLQDVVSVLDFIPQSEHAAIKAGTSTYDATAAIQAAIDSLGTTIGLTPPASGGTVYFPVGKYLISSTVNILTQIVLQGEGSLSEILIPDGVTAFKFGQLASEGTRVDVLGGVRDLGFRGVAGSAGNVAETLGTTNPSFGFTTATTTLAGWKDAGGANASNVALNLAGFYAPFDVTGCSFIRLGLAIGIGGQYGLTISNNRILYCKIGIETVSQAPTTINITNNTIERCAVGVFFKYPSSFLRVDHNIIEANYAGCDIYLFNGPKDLEITRNYFEASPSNIVVRSDSSLPFIAERVYIARNTGVDFYIRTGAFHNYVFKENWLNQIDVQLYAGGTVSNVVLDSNYNGATSEPFDPANLIIGSAAAAYAHEISYKGRYKATNLAVGTTTLFPLGTVRSRKFYKNVTGAGPDPAFSVLVPAASCVAAFTITAFGFGSAAPTKRVVWQGAINRASGTVTCTAAVIKSIEEDIPVLGGASLAVPTPTVTITGGTSDVQTVVFNLLNGNSGGSTRSWFYTVEATISNMGVDFA